MSDPQWHSYDTPPENDRIVRLRFDDTGERDCDGFFRGSYYRSEDGYQVGRALHPIAWRERQESHE